jgi:hypothetical protein
MILSRLARENPVVIESVTDPAEQAQARSEWGRFDRNWAWFKAHAGEIYEAHRGKRVCVAGEEAFAADTASEAIAQARAAHPTDDGWFFIQIPREKAARIYVTQG